MDELRSNWDNIKESIREEYEITDLAYKTWIDPLRLGEIKNNTVYILVPKEKDQSIFIIKKKYYDAFKMVINEALGRSYDDQYDISFISENESKKPDKDTSLINKEEKYDKANLNKNYTFDTFVVGSNNNLAHSGAVAVSENPGENYNPLFIYGGVGLGKTHLMHAIGHHIIDQDPDKSVLYVTSEEFTHDIVEALGTGRNPDKINRCREKYRNIDVLLLDDIQFIIGKNTTQEEFFHTFNDLYKQNKQIVITSDKPPKDMDVLEERFRSRFVQGLIVDIQSPDFETRMAILQKKVEAFRYNFDNDVLSYIANYVQSNIRELEGAVKKVAALADLEKKEIDIDLAKEALKDIVSPNSHSTITPDNIIRVVSDHYNISIEDIKSKHRTRDIVIPRKIIMYLCRNMTNATYMEIASILGGKDHSTVMYGERTIIDLMEKDEGIRRTVETIINKIKSD